MAVVVSNDEGIEALGFGDMEGPSSGNRNEISTPFRTVRTATSLNVSGVSFLCAYRRECVCVFYFKFRIKD